MNLEKYYENYVNKIFNLSELNEQVIEYVYNYVKKDKYIEPGDFILDFIPRSESIIIKYNNELASFQHYINKHIKWLMFSFSKLYIKEKEKSEAFNYHNIAEFKDNLYLKEESVDYKISEEALILLAIKNGKISKESSKKRLEIFTLKNSRTLTNDQIQILAPLLDRTTDWIYNKKEILENLCTKRIENRNYLKERYNRLFIEITKDQNKLLTMPEGYEKRITTEKLREKQRKKEDLIIKLKKRNCGPKNEEIARLLKIPKGTVDSSLFYMKKTLESLLPGLIID